MYKLLKQDEQDDIIISFYLAQERDKFCHEVNLQRYDRILSEKIPDDWRKRIVQLKEETLARLGEVNSIIAATDLQLPSKARMDASVLRLNNRAQVS